MLNIHNIQEMINCFISLKHDIISLKQVMVPIVLRCIVMKIIYNNEFNYKDIAIYEYGVQQCEPNFSFGPGIRDFYIIHFIMEGSGEFYVNGENYKLNKGEGFIIEPNRLISYKADSSDPWKYYWVGFYGTDAQDCIVRSGFNMDKPIFTISNISFVERCFKEVMEGEILGSGREYFLKGYFYIILSQQIEKSIWRKEISSNSMKQIYVKKAIEFIEINYSKKITIEILAKYIGINSKYMWRIFKISTGISPKIFIIETRIRKATLLLKNPKLSISDVSRSVGYEDPLQFSKIFKKIKGLAPKEYRRVM